MSAPAYGEQDFRDAIADLLCERDWSQRELADAVGVDPAHISRLLKRGSSARATPQLLARVARAFGLAPEFFVEYREWCVLEAVRSNPSLREQIYARVVASPSIHEAREGDGSGARSQS
jgi:plasmid maintenance system antidote protein VapI